MTHGGRLIAGTVVWTGGAFEASRRLMRDVPADTAREAGFRGAGGRVGARPSPRQWRRCRTAASSATTQQPSAVLKAATHRGSQHQIHGAVPAVGKRQHCGAVGYGTH